MTDANGGARSLGRVLVVDDDENIRRALDVTLHRLGYQVFTAGDGQAGLELAASQHPQVILTDLRMPGVDGHTLLRRLTSAHIPSAVVVMSGQGNMDDVVDILRAGAVDYLRKPWNARELANAVARAFELYEQKAHGEAPPAGEPPPSGPTTAADPWNQILTRVRNGEILLPAVPSVVASLRSLTQDPNVSVDRVAALIEQDQRLAADVLRLSNTAHYARGGRNHSIKNAVSRIGFRQIHNIVETAMLRGAFQSHDREISGLLTQIWRHSVARAIAMRMLAGLKPADNHTVHLDPDTAYLVGLLADVGASFLLWVADQRKSAGVPLGSVQPEFLAHVRSHHEEVGAALLKQWLPDPAVITAVGAHHIQASHPASGYGALAVLAGDRVAAMQIGADLTAAAPPSSTLIDQCAADLGLDRAAVTNALGPLQDSFAAIVGSFD